jgi:hypothetical protein
VIFSNKPSFKLKSIEGIFSTFGKLLK